jgi:hypothetical protein
LPASKSGVGFALSLVLSVASAEAQYVRVSVASDGTPANFSSVTPSISRTGRFVAFSSAATNLVAGDSSDGRPDIFLHDRDADADGVFDEPGAIATLKVSRFSDGSDIAGTCDTPTVAGDGRYVIFFTNQSAPGQPEGQRHLARWDRLTGELLIVDVALNGQPSESGIFSAGISHDGRLVVFSSNSPDIVAGASGSGVYLRDMEAGLTRRISDEAPLPQPPMSPGFWTRGSPSLSGDGRLAAWLDVYTLGLSGGQLSGFVRVLDLVDGTMTEAGRGSSGRISADGRFITGLDVSSPTTTLFRHHIQTGDRRTFGTVTPVAGQTYSHSLSGRYVVSQQNGSGTLFDADFETSSALPFGGIIYASFDETNRYLAFDSGQPLDAGDNNNAIDIFVVELPRIFDTDQDTLDDRWERFFGLSVLTGIGVEGPTGDADGDGRTNAQEFAAGTHPRGFFKRYLAEGATGSFFRTRFAVANAGSLDVPAIVSYARGDGHVVNTPFPVRASHRRTLNPAAVDGFAATDFSTIVESDRPLVVDRTMSWGAASPLDGIGYGAHSENSAEPPSTQWFLAEGSTVLDFQLFYLLQNPQDTPVDATVLFLRPSGPIMARPYVLPPHSRTTIRVNDIPVMGSTDVSGRVIATSPIIVERAMYASRNGQFFGLGHASRGVTAPAVTWFLAEGATGPFFDTYVLIANPSLTAATIDARFDTGDGASVTRQYAVASQSRFSIHLDSIPGLEFTSVATTITSTNAVPVVVERAMYWPNGFFDYYEGHSSPGTTQTGLKWVLAEGENGPGQTFVLIANTAATAGRARLTLMPESSDAPHVFELPLAPNSRVTVPIDASRNASGRFGVLVESIGAAPVPIVVEGAFYWTIDGVTWAAGSNLVATSVP